MDAFTPHGFTFDIPPEDSADPFAPAPEFAPEFPDVFADAPQPENFLAQARRSARAAAEKAESERRGRFAGFFQKETHDDEEKAKSRLLIPLIVALVVVAAGAAALVLSRHANAPEQPAVTRPAAPVRPSAPLPPQPEPLPPRWRRRTSRRRPMARRLTRRLAGEDWRREEFPDPARRTQAATGPARVCLRQQLRIR